MGTSCAFLVSKREVMAAGHVGGCGHRRYLKRRLPNTHVKTRAYVVKFLCNWLVVHYLCDGTRGHVTVNTKHLYNINTKLAQRRRRWADVV